MIADNFPSQLTYPRPFASLSDALAPIGDSQDADSINFSDGFPSVYSAPKSNNGKFVTRGEINAIGNLATVNDFYRMCGGINKFNPEFAQKIGGYAQGAILEFYDGNVVKRVVSLVDNNLVDYTSVGVDGVNWAYCDHEIGTEPVLLTENNTGSIDALNTSSSVTVIFAGKLLRGGYIYPSIKWGETDAGSLPTEGHGHSLVITYKRPDDADFSGPVYIASTIAENFPVQYQPIYLPAGTVLSVSIVVHWENLSDSTIKLYLN